MVPLKKEMAGSVNGNQGCYSFSRKVKGKAFFPSQGISAHNENRLPFSVHHLHSLVARDAIYCPERMALPRKDQNSSSVPAWNFNIHKPFVSTSWEEIA